MALHLTQLLPGLREEQQAAMSLCHSLHTTHRGLQVKPASFWLAHELECLENHLSFCQSRTVVPNLGSWRHDSSQGCRASTSSALRWMDTQTPTPEWCCGDKCPVVGQLGFSATHQLEQALLLSLASQPHHLPIRRKDRQVRNLLLGLKHCL